MSVQDSDTEISFKEPHRTLMFTAMMCARFERKSVVSRSGEAVFLGASPLSCYPLSVDRRRYVAETPHGSCRLINSNQAESRSTSCNSSTLFFTAILTKKYHVPGPGLIVALHQPSACCILSCVRVVFAPSELL